MTNPKPTGIIESLTARIENLEALAEDQARDIAHLRAEVAWRGGDFRKRLRDMYKQGRFDEAVEAAHGDPEPSKPVEPLFTYEEISETAQQQRRDAIIEQAKCDVERLLWIGSNDRFDLDDKESPFHGKWFDCDFVVNRKKRTVAALIYALDGFSKRPYKRVFRYPRARGIAKCAPDDCFNVHIGKAIALRRALELDVPDAYVNAPQPTEVRVGDIVDSPGTGTFEVTRQGLTERLTEIVRKPDVPLRIIDDSREEVTAD